MRASPPQRRPVHDSCSRYRWATKPDWLPNRVIQRRLVLVGVLVVLLVEWKLLVEVLVWVLVCVLIVVLVGVLI